jgi:TIR domain
MTFTVSSLGLSNADRAWDYNDTQRYKRPAATVFGKIKPLRDRSEVFKRVQGLRAVKVSFFQDLLSLEPGDPWHRQICPHIDQCDLFFLFWSKAASESVGVDEEVEYAILRKAGNDDAPPEIVPVILESRRPAPPPELSYLHFDDYIMSMINEEAVSKPAESEAAT